MCLIAKEVSKGGPDAVPCALIVHIMRRMTGLRIHDDIPLWVECLPVHLTYIIEGETGEDYGRHGHRLNFSSSLQNAPASLAETKGVFNGHLPVSEKGFIRQGRNG